MPSGSDGTGTRGATTPNAAPAPAPKATCRRLAVASCCPLLRLMWARFSSFEAIFSGGSSPVMPRRLAPSMRPLINPVATVPATAPRRSDLTGPTSREPASMLPGPEESATGEEQYEQNDDDDPEHW